MKISRKFLYVLISILLTAASAACRAPADTSQTKNETTQGTTAGSTAGTTAHNGAAQIITPAEAREMLKNDKTVVLLDVRTAEEYAESHIPGSRLLPYDEIANRVSDLPGDKATPIIVYCRTGRRSAIAAQTLLELGFTKVYDLGGIQSWPYETEK